MELGNVLHKQEWKHNPPYWKAGAEYEVARTGGEVPKGPWDDEPDKVQWIDGATDLDCLAVRNPMGAWCGYVGVPPGHPLYEKSAFDPPAERLSVHGGLTFSAKCDEDAREGHGICHIPLPGREADIWWLGFDCGHAWDLQPGLLALGMGRLVDDSVYRDLEYVMEQCAILALQVMIVRTHPELLEDDE